MENTNIRNTEVSKVLIWFGAIVLIISLIDLFVIVFPLHLSDPEWVFNVTQGVITSILAPILSIALLLCGFYFNKNAVTSKKLLNTEKFVGLMSLLFAIALFTNLIIYSLSMKAYETKLVSTIQTQQETVLKQLDAYKKSPQLNIPESVYKNKVDEINQAALNQIKGTKRALLKKNIKSIIEMILYIALTLVISIISYSSANLNCNKLKFVK